MTTRGGDEARPVTAQPEDRIRPTAQPEDKVHPTVARFGIGCIASFVFAFGGMKLGLLSGGIQTAIIFLVCIGLSFVVALLMEDRRDRDDGQA